MRIYFRRRRVPNDIIIIAIILRDKFDKVSSLVSWLVERKLRLASLIQHALVTKDNIKNV